MDKSTKNRFINKSLDHLEAIIVITIGLIIMNVLLPMYLSFWTSFIIGGVLGMLLFFPVHYIIERIKRKE